MNDDGIIIIYLSITSFSAGAALKPYERESNLIQLSLNGNLSSAVLTKENDSIRKDFRKFNFINVSSADPW